MCLVFLFGRRMNLRPLVSPSPSGCSFFASAKKGERVGASATSAGATKLTGYRFKSCHSETKNRATFVALFFKLIFNLQLSPDGAVIRYNLFTLFIEKRLDTAIHEDIVDTDSRIHFRISILLDTIGKCLS